MRRTTVSVTVPLLLVAIVIGLNIHRPVRELVLWAGGLVLFVIVLNLLVNPQLFRRGDGDR